jgi:hypothetical protein
VRDLFYLGGSDFKVDAMIQTYPQIGPNRLSGDADEWRILIRLKEEAPTAVYTVPQALFEADRLQQSDEHELALKIREAAKRVPCY